MRLEGRRGSCDGRRLPGIGRAVARRFALPAEGARVALLDKGGRGSTGRGGRMRSGAQAAAPSAWSPT